MIGNSPVYFKRFYSGYSGSGSCSGSYFLKIRSNMMQAVRVTTEKPQMVATAITKASIFTFNVARKKSGRTLQRARC